MIDHLKQRLGTPSIIGAVLIFPISSAIVGIVPYAVVASLIGESRLESGEGLTGLGMLILYSPAAVGVLLIVADYFNLTDFRPNQKQRFWGFLLAGLALLLLTAVMIASTEPGNPNIGAGVVGLTGLGLTIASLASRPKTNNRL